MLRTDQLEEGARRQVALAELAETDEVRAVHQALEQLYRTQLVAMELARRLAPGRDRTDLDQHAVEGRIRARR